LGTAGQFAVLAGSGITNTGPTTITGDVGTFPTTSETGFGTVTLNGVNHGGDAVTQQAKTDLTTGYGVATGSGPPTAVAVELGGTTLTPGVYKSPTFGITGTLTLDTLGDPNAVFIFQAASTLTTASNSSVVVLNGGTACNVFWQIGSSATLGTGSHLIGSVLADTAITATTGATIQGRLLARTAAVTLDTNTITVPFCAAAAPTTTTTSPTTTSTTTPSTTTTPPVAALIGAPTPPGPAVGPSPSSAPTGRSGSTSSDIRTGTTRSRGGSAIGTTGRSRLPATGISLSLLLFGALTLASGLVLCIGTNRRRSPAPTRH
jgi:hypothetical protein